MNITIEATDYRTQKPVAQFSDSIAAEGFVRERLIESPHPAAEHLKAEDVIAQVVSWNGLATDYPEIDLTLRVVSDDKEGTR